MKNKPTILVVDDSAMNIEILVEIMDDYSVAVSLDGNRAIEIAQNSTIDLILLDIMMPIMDGFEVCKKLKQNPKTKDIPIIFITAKTDEESIKNAYNAGGVDYITKPFMPNEVLARVKVHIERASYIKQLEYLASYDEMTGIYNRRKFFELSTILFENTEENELFAIIFDIDYFKKINDTYGHPGGDIVIQTVTKTIANIIPLEAIFGRIGGEEFAMLIHLSSKDDAVEIIEQCRRTVEELCIKYNHLNLQCTVSTGMACKDNTTTSLDLLLSKADEALYDAKNGGRNRLIFRT